MINFKNVMVSTDGFTKEEYIGLLHMKEDVEKYGVDILCYSNKYINDQGEHLGILGCTYFYNMGIVD